MYRDEWTRKALKQYEALPPDVRPRIDEALDELLENPFHATGVKALSGPLAGYLRRRVGDWRIIFKVESGAQVLYVMAVVPRKDAY